ncbi:MAG: branched-chain amino acid aminotransferase [Clostridiales bacterium]|nr:branched-chain amino acid aminotransferase [Clostridiales bacterium]
MKIVTEKTLTPKQKPIDEGQLGFGKIFTDHMLLIDYDQQKGWHNGRIVPYGDFSMDPASMVFHYGQAIFEGMKCYRTKEGNLQLFRPLDNFIRMNESSKRLSIPPMDPSQRLEALEELLRLEKDWVPKNPGTTMYIRPAIIATQAMLGVKASSTYLFFVILSPSGAYYANGLAPVGIYVEDEFVRAVRGGIGASKAAGNYAASILASEAAGEKGYAQVLWLDGVERKYIEEVGAMNMMFVYEGKKIVTPKLNGSILPGITRDSVIKLARHMGFEVEEAQMSIQEVFEDIQQGKITEAFGTGTAAVISPVGHLYWKGTTAKLGDGGIGPISQKLYDTLTGIQFGEIEDPMGWVHTL